MSLAAFGLLAQKWVEKNLREEDVEVSDDSLLLALGEIKPFKGNWTKAMAVTGLTVEEQLDLVQGLLKLDVAAMAKNGPGWVTMLAEMREEIRDAVREAQIRSATPARNNPKETGKLEEKEFINVSPIERPVRGGRRAPSQSEIDPDVEAAGKQTLGIKKPEIRMRTQERTENVLDYFVSFELQLSDVAIEETDRKTLFKSGLNEVCRNAMLLGKQQIFADVEEMVEWICKMLKIGPGTVLKERDSLRQEPRESSLEFWSRWERTARKGAVLGMTPELFENGELFISRLTGGEMLATLLSAGESLMDISLKAEPLQLMLGPGRGHRPVEKQSERVRYPKPASGTRPEADRRPERKTRSTVCFRCGKEGHIKRDCPEKNKRVQAQANERAEAAFGWIGETEVKLLLDNCADVSCISDKTVEENKLGAEPSSGVYFRWGFTEVRPASKVKTLMAIGDQVREVELQVVDRKLFDAEVLLSKKDSARFGFKMQRTDEQPEELYDLPQPLENLNANVVEIPEEASEELVAAAKKVPMATSLKDLRRPANLPQTRFFWKTDTVPPITAYRRRYRPEEMAYLRKRTQELLEAGILSRPKTPVKWSSPWQVVPKKDGSFRDVIDMRAVNMFMEPSAFPVRTVQDVLSKMSGWKRKGQFDLKAAFWQLEMCQLDKERCAVSNGEEVLLQERLGMGALDSSAQLEEALENELVRPISERIEREKVRGAMTIYRDNVYYGCETEEQERFILLCLAERCEKLNLKMGTGQVGMKRLELLGFDLTEDTLSPVKSQLEKIGSFPVPTGKRQVKSFLGKCGYYRMFVKDFATLTAPLESLVTKGKGFAWNTASDEAFRKLKSLFNAELICASYRSELPSSIFTDASDVGLGAVLVQQGKIVRYCSKRLKGAQLKYSVTRREALAVLLAVKEFYHLTREGDVVYTDHQPLVGWAKGSASVDTLLERWGLKFMESHLRLEYVKGVDNGVADQASRNMVLAQTNAGMEEVIKEYLMDTTKEVPKEVQRKSRRYKLEAGKLYYRGKLVPDMRTEERRRWLRELHDELGHASATKLDKMVLVEFDWENRTAEIEKVIMECDSCQRGEYVAAAPSMMKGKRSDWWVMDEWSMDLLPDLVRTKRGNTQLLVFVEAVSDYIHAFPLKTRQSEEVAGGIYWFLSVFGIPRRLRCDQGVEFQGNVVRLCERMGITMKIIGSHHPQSNGQCERMNRVVVDSLTRMNTDEDWDVDFMAAVKAHNWTVSRRTGRSPHEVLFGVSPRIPLMTAEETKADGDEMPEVGNLLLRLGTCRRELMRSVQERLRKYEAGPADIKEGDLVLVRNFSRRKFDPKWVGPMVVIRRQAFSVAVKGENGKERVLNLGDVKPYRKSGEVVGAVVEAEIESTTASDATMMTKQRVPEEE